jgi:hypothetical protein
MHHESITWWIAASTFDSRLSGLGKFFAGLAIACGGFFVVLMVLWGVRTLVHRYEKVIPGMWIGSIPATVIAWLIFGGIGMHPAGQPACRHTHHSPAVAGLISENA